MKPHGTPKAMSEADIKTAIGEYVQAAKNAVAAGIDGIELHGTNGYLIEQFIRPNSNQRKDAYGGSVENRARFGLEVAKAVIAAIGKDKVGIRLSPFGAFNDMPPYSEMEADYAYLARQLNALGLALCTPRGSFVDGRPGRAAVGERYVSQGIQRRAHYSGGYDAAGAETDLAAGKADLIAVGRPFLANPDLIKRWKSGAALNAPDPTTFYTPGPKGYTDYPALAKQPQPA